MKRTFDATVSFLGLVLLSPFLLTVAVFIKLDSRGPVLFRQQRIGKEFRPFLICKFRTMLKSRSGPVGLSLSVMIRVLPGREDGSARPRSTSCRN